MLSQETGKHCKKSSAYFQCTRNIKGQWLVKWGYGAGLAVLCSGENQLGWGSKKVSQTSQLSQWSLIRFWLNKIFLLLHIYDFIWFWELRTCFLFAWQSFSRLEIRTTQMQLTGKMSKSLAVSDLTFYVTEKLLLHAILSIHIVTFGLDLAIKKL